MKVAALENDFVTYQAIRSYLKKVRGAKYSPDDSDPIEREIANVQRFCGRISTVTEGKLKQLRDGDYLTLGDFRTIVNVRVYCEDCNTQLGVEELLETGSCNCAQE